jgi:hypothetical protein
MSVERSGPAVGSNSEQREASGVMIKAPVRLQDPRPEDIHPGEGGL